MGLHDPMNQSLSGFIVPWHYWEVLEERRQGLIGGSRHRDISLELYFVLVSSAFLSLLSVYQEGKENLYLHF